MFKDEILNKSSPDIKREYKKRKPAHADFLGEATAGIEPAMKVLQTFALPLGDVA